MPVVRTPLAWYNLTHNKRRLAVALAGVTFAVVLMFVEWGFRNAMLDSTVALVDHIDGDLIIVHQRSYSLVGPVPFSRQRLFQALAVEGVRETHPIYLEYGATWLNPQDRKQHSIRAIGVNPKAHVLDFPELQTRSAELHLPYRILFDTRSRLPSYGINPSQVSPDEEFSLGGKSVHIVGTFALGTDFGTEGNVLMSDATFMTLFRPLTTDSSPAGVDIGVVRLNEGADRREVQRRLADAIGEDVVILTKDEFSEREKSFWKNSTPIGFAFGFGMAIGFTVGVVICYQVLATDVADHLPQFATLKAIGYSNRYVIGVVLQEALLLGTVGFIPGLLISLVIYEFLSVQTGLPMKPLPDRILFLFALTIGMCIVSGLIAQRKVQTADPAEVFG
ncbi:MAG TPA: ABC transporter permease DevC [Gemmataceae bacterium]|nr:ABC transporter permease DevC [Gemmataceae bacterium]